MPEQRLRGGLFSVRSGADGERAAVFPVRLLHGRRGLHHALHQLHRGAAPQGVPQGEEQELPGEYVYGK